MRTSGDRSLKPVLRAASGLALIVTVAGCPGLDPRLVETPAQDPGAGAGHDGGNPADAGSGNGDGGAGADSAYNGPYYGGLHSHTSYADPDYAGTPLDAFETARSYVLPGTDVDINRGTDWWAVTDYYWSLSLLNPEYWTMTFEQAAQVRAEGFPAIVGWEWSNTKLGGPSQRDHIGCFPLNQIDPPLPPSEKVSTLSGLFSTAGLRKNPHLCSFNHPEMRSDAEPLPAFDGFRYDAAADEFMSLIDIRGNNGGFRGYFQALNMGWHVSPTKDEDNKDWSWGLKMGAHGQQRRVGVFARERSVDAIIGGLKDGATFATSDKSISVWMTAEGRFMGSVFKGARTLELSLHARDADEREEVTLPYYPIVCDNKGCSPPAPEDSVDPEPDSPFFVEAYLYTNGGSRLDGGTLPLTAGKVLKKWTGLHSREFDEAVVVTPTEDGSNAENATSSVWYVLRLVQSDGDEAITAPIFVHFD
ncbi:MAG: hypothetical protein HY897_20755 [Deltaproteobacteria bacterium]|nr:hypothetical protein [Deltaproteobacteria bacterium]